MEKNAFAAILLAIAATALCGCLAPNFAEEYKWIILTNEEANSVGYSFTGQPFVENGNSGVSQTFNVGSPESNDFVNITYVPRATVEDANTIFSEIAKKAYPTGVSPSANAGSQCQFGIGDECLYEDNQIARATVIAFRKGRFVISVSAGEKDITRSESESKRSQKAIALARLIEAKIVAHENLPDESCTANEDCDDNNKCTVDYCNTKTKKCQHTQYEDGTYCGKDKECRRGACVISACASIECNDGNPCTAEYCDTNTGKCKYTNLGDGTTCGTETNALPGGGVEHVPISQCKQGRCIGISFDDPSAKSAFFPTASDLDALHLAALSIRCNYHGWSMYSKPAYNCWYDADRGGKMYEFIVAIYEWDIANNPDYAKYPEQNYDMWEQKKEDYILVKEGFAGEKSHIIRDDKSNTWYSRITAGMLKNNVLVHLEAEDIKLGEPGEEHYQLLEDLARKIAEKIK